MEKKIYQALNEGEVVCEGTYERCLAEIGVYTLEDGWMLPTWKDVAIVEKI